jgi:DnaK suppressor protein
MMAKKKVTTKKKTRASSRAKVTKKKTTKKKTAKKTAAGKKKTTKTAAKKKKKTTASRTKKKVTRASTGKTAKKTAAPAKKTAASAKKTAAPAKKPPAAKSTTKADAAAEVPARKTTRKTAAGKATASKVPAIPAPDANGYVIINGRRVRMMSAPVRSLAAKRHRNRAAAAAAPTPAAMKDKVIKTKLKKRELDHYRQLLLERRRELVGDLSAMEEQALQAASSNVSHMPIHMADIGTDTYDQDFMLGMAESERARLREIDHALARIADRTYGICQMTGKPIPKARLNAKPWARYTIEAAREIERGLGE